MHLILAASQIIISVSLIVLILLQQRGAGGSSIFGGGTADYYTKRGMEKVFFIATIVLAGLFIGLAFLSLLI